MQDAARGSGEPDPRHPATLCQLYLAQLPLGHVAVRRTAAGR